MAAPSSSEGAFTLDIPMLDPPLLGLTNTGNCNCAAIWSGFSNLPLTNRTECATCMPLNAATATVKRLLKVSAEVDASQLV